MSKVQVVFPICDFSLERELDLYEEITDEIIWSVVEEAIKKLYGGLLNPSSKKLNTKQVADTYTSYDAYNKPFENTCFDLMVGNNKVNEHGQFNPLGESGLDIISEHPLTKEQLASYYKTVLERQLATHEQEANYHLQHCEALRAKIEQAERGFYE